MKKVIKKTSDNAVVGMVSAVLIIGLIVAVISIIQVVYVPIIMEQREAEHMDVVAKEFASLTSVIDNQAADGRTGVPIPTFVTLGNKELPFLVSSKAFGSLEILYNPLLDNACAITVTNSSGSQTFPLGVITYSSDNAYYLEQSYTYEAGAMIVSQSQGNMMMVPPFFFIDYNESKQPPLTITFDVVNISSVGNKTIASGFGTYPIQTEFDTISSNITFINVSRMTISTPYSNAWFVFINRSLLRTGLNPDGKLTLTDTQKALQLDVVLPDYFPINVILRIVEIKAQIGPGWIN